MYKVLKIGVIEFLEKVFGILFFKFYSDTLWGISFSFGYYLACEFTPRLYITAPEASAAKTVYI